jgi:hypothetical protein
MRWNFTLPELQEKLDHLADGGILPINAQDYERLFGTNDVAVTACGISPEVMLAWSATPMVLFCFARDLRRAYRPAHLGGD